MTLKLRQIWLRMVATHLLVLLVLTPHEQLLLIVSGSTAAPIAPPKEFRPQQSVLPAQDLSCHPHSQVLNLVSETRKSNPIEKDLGG